jgi:flagellar basal-body rod modification protein FlgD
MVTTVNNYTYTPTNTSGAGANSAAEMQDRFLTLLVAQINNQDPLNPMDNAQMTTQMAQINTVSGIQQLNETMKSMNTQFNAMQVLQGTALVGRDVLIPGNTLWRDTTTGMAGSAFDLGGSASQVKIEILSPSGVVLDTITSGAMEAGRNSFTWDGSDYKNYPSLSYRVTAVNKGEAVAATTYSSDRVLAVGTVNGLLNLDLMSGQSVPYSKIAAVF